MQILQNKYKLYIEEIRNLKKENNDLNFKLNFDRKCKENQTNLNKLNYQQTKEKYEIDVEIHLKNIKSIYSFLNQISKSFEIFVNKYSIKKKQEDGINNDMNDISDDNDNDILIRDIEPKLKATYGNFQQFLSDISMIILSKENDNNDIDLMLSDIDI